MELATKRVMLRVLTSSSTSRSSTTASVVTRRSVASALQSSTQPGWRSSRRRGGRRKGRCLVPEKPMEGQASRVARAFLVYMLPPLPRRSDWRHYLAHPSSRDRLPHTTVGSSCASSFSRIARRSLTLRPAHSRCHQFVARLPQTWSRHHAGFALRAPHGPSGDAVLPGKVFNHDPPSKKANTVHQLFSQR